MRAARTLCLVGAALLLAAPAAWADWDPGDGHKMHFPQLPDPFGWDVAFAPAFPMYVGPNELADDWLCTETGPVEDIHIWFSWSEGWEGPIPSILVAIYSDDPVGPHGYSQPRDILWEKEFLAGEFTTRPAGAGDQGFYDPATDYIMEHDHDAFFQLNIVDILDPFIQTEGEVYWLSLTVNCDPVSGPIPGWKTADVDSYPEPDTGQHYRDDAVWRCMGMNVWEWQELVDPLDGESLDLAFVITPEPATLGLLAVGALALLRRRA